MVKGGDAKRTRGHFSFRPGLRLFILQYFSKVVPGHSQIDSRFYQLMHGLPDEADGSVDRFAQVGIGVDELKDVEISAVRAGG